LTLYLLSGCRNLFAYREGGAKSRTDPLPCFRGIPKMQRNGETPAARQTIRQSGRRAQWLGTFMREIVQRVTSSSGSSPEAAVSIYDKKVYAGWNKSGVVKQLHDSSFAAAPTAFQNAVSFAGNQTVTVAISSAHHFQTKRGIYGGPACSQREAARSRSKQGTSWPVLPMLGHPYLKMEEWSW